MDTFLIWLRFFGLIFIAKGLWGVFSSKISFFQIIQTENSKVYSRRDDPVGYWFVVAITLAGGLAMCFYAWRDVIISWVSSLLEAVRG